jgi:hypothetical protein
MEGVEVLCSGDVVGERGQWCKGGAEESALSFFLSFYFGGTGL